MFALRLAVVTIFAAADMASCAARNPAEPGRSGAIEQLLGALRQRGLRVTLEGAVPRSQTPYFSVTAQRLLVEASAVHGSARIEVCEYASPSAAASDERRYRPMGSRALRPGLRGSPHPGSTGRND